MVLPLFEEFCILQALPILILGTKQHFCGINGPFYTDGRIVKPDTGLCLRCIHIVYLIGEHSFVTEYEKSVSHSTWYEKLTLIFSTQFHGHITAKCR